MTALDTAYNYSGFTSHRALRIAAGELLDDFDLSTKVGFFRDGHDLEPTRLRAAVEESAEHLGRRPNTVLLHNPETSPTGITAACEALAAMREAGLFERWGISSWDPRLLLHSPYRGPRPDVLMVRAGLMAPTSVLEAADALTHAVRPRERWGMASFGHNANDPVWNGVDASVFLAPGQTAPMIHAAFVVAFSLPAVVRVAVGTTNPDHLRELNAACSLAVNDQAIGRYRAILHQKATFGALHAYWSPPGVRA